METLARITETRIIPDLRPTKQGQILPLLAALCSGGVNAACFSAENPLTPEALHSGSRLFPDLMLGVDGITTLAEGSAAIGHGARFLSSAGYSDAIAALCKEHEVLYLPKCMTPTELLAVQTASLPACALFAPHLWGGRELVTALAAAFPKLTLIAAGVPYESAPALLALPGIKAAAVTGLASASPEELAAACSSLLHQIPPQ